MDSPVCLRTIVLADSSLSRMSQTHALTGIGFIAGGLSYIISRGAVASLPSMSKFGVKPVVSFTVDLQAIIMYGKYSSQSVWLSFTNALSIVVGVLLNISTIPSDWGWYGVVMVFSM